MESVLEDRLERIESKISLSEDLLESLNHTVFRQQEQIDRLQEQVRMLADRISDLNLASGGRDPQDEVPPHY